MKELDQRLRRIIDWIRQTTDVENGRGVLVPLSGGSDSALCFWLCCQALPAGHIAGVHLGQQLHCHQWFAEQGPVELVPLQSVEANPEIERWAKLLHLSLKRRRWLVGTRNRTEDVLGTYSLASRVATYLPLVGLWKSEVMELAKHIAVPGEILESSQRADPHCGRPVEMAEVPFEFVDRFLMVKLKERDEAHLQQIPPGMLDYLDRIYQRYEFKRILPFRAPSGVAENI